MKKRSPELPPEDWVPKNGRDLFQAVFSSALEQMPESGKAHKEVWRRALKVARRTTRTGREYSRKQLIEQSRSEGWSSDRVAAESQYLEQYIRDAMDEADRIEEKIENSSTAELKALGKGMKHKANLVGRVPGQAITAIDLNSSLKVSDSTTIMLNHDRAYERGTFEETETFPQADIGGRIGKSDVSGLLQLRPAGQDAAEAQVMADRLRDPKEAVGVRASQISRILVSIWSSSKDAEGMATVTINQLAEELGFTADAEGGFSGITYQRIREAVRFLEAGYSRIAGGEKSRVAFESAMWSFTRISVVEGEVDTFRDDWTTLRFRPEWAHARLLEGEKTYLMGRDHELNKLDPIRQRYEQRLCVWIEEQLRFNWDREPGLLRRKARTLLNEGMGFDADVSRRDKKLIDKLFRALRVAEDKGTIEQWQPDDGWVITFHAEMQTPRSKCRESDWRRFLDSSFQLFAGTKYEEHYANHGAARITDGLVAALNELIREGHSQVLVAKEIGISPSALSQFRSGKSGLKPKTREALEQYLARQGKPFQGELPLLDL